MQPDRLIDLSGLNCPLPILRSKKALAEMDSGTVLEVIATDPGAPKDFEAFCRQTGNALLVSETTAEGKFRMVIRRK
ncbi:sulfurtransferase TusA family protein [Pseudogulbenkiania sp. MAI-1]|uniref:sulfurtransferase TusA family protein n=1 Tax=Pseudogulbenkiania sp. MAI-1 TaxID=990370 RepID=UPI00045E6E4D|nr:sulfurtransferase TusA family protein [Pseudogulbenkiania sp. MAI-1]